MAASGGAGVAAPAREDPSRPAVLELFFDLAYVFALIALTEKLVHQLTWAGAGQTLVLLLAFTLIWALTVWSGDLVDLSRPVLLPRVIGGMAGSLLLAAAVADAYGSRGLLFAVTYVTTHLGAGVYYLLVLGSAAPRIRTRRILSWEAIAGVGWIIGGLLAGTSRGVLWAVAIAVEYAGAILGWPVPWLAGPLPRQEQRLVGERISERYRQFVIVALAVPIFVIGRSYSEGDYTIRRAGALIVAFMITVLIWRMYIYRAGELMTITIAKSANPSRLSQFAAYTHLIMVAGIVGVAVTSQLVISRPFGETPPPWAAVILGGPALFLIGRALFDYIVFAQVSRARLVGLALLAGLAPLTSLLPPILVAFAVAAILAFVATTNLIATRTHPATPAPRQ